MRLQIAAPNPHKVIREHGPREEKDESVLDQVRRVARIFAHAADLALTQFEGRSLLLSGSTQLRPEVMRELPKSLQQRVGAAFSVEIHARPLRLPLPRSLLSVASKNTKRWRRCSG
jgi:hypothetical protein